MSLSLLPDLIVEELTDLTPEYLEHRHIRLLMMDFDNTIVPYTTDIPTEKMKSWLYAMVQSPIHICVVSNSRKGRVVTFCREYGIDCVVRAKKPGTRGIRECLNRCGVPASEAALAGDQIFTDTLGSNLAGVMSVLVRPINNHNIWLKLRHVAEMPFIYAARKRRNKHEKS